jgi:hypothetical protein
MAGAKLTDTQVSKAKGKDKPYKMADGGGLFLHGTAHLRRALIRTTKAGSFRSKISTCPEVRRVYA